MKYIQCHLNEPLHIDTIAETFYWNKAYLQIKFKKEVGISLHDYIIREKISLAQSLISINEYGETSLAEIAEKTGFPTYSTFYRNFIKITGLSPQDVVDNMRREKH